MLKLEIDQTELPSEFHLSEERIKHMEQECKATIPNIPEGVIAVAFISDEEMLKLNTTYRGKEKTTDVLSFSYLEEGDAETLGDIVISLEQAKRQAEDGVEKELTMLILHGVLHVLGYDHENEQDAKKMFPLQDKMHDALYEK